MSAAGPPPEALSLRLPRGHVTVVTGAGRGIGLACARAVLAAGGNVALADLKDDQLEEARLAVDPEGERSSAHRVDVSDQTSVTELIRDVAGAHGQLDAVINAAGRLQVAPALELTAEDWEANFSVNARGSFLVATEAARHFIEAETSGRIVLFGSIVARVARPNNLAYCASKAAAAQINRCLAFELAHHGINVNMVTPGSTATEMLVGDQLGKDPDAIRGVIEGDASRWRLGIPLGRLAEPGDQAAAALFLISEGSRHITGTEIVVDGGQTVV